MKWKELLTQLFRQGCDEYPPERTIVGGDDETTSACTVVEAEGVTILALGNDDLIINGMID